MRRDASVGGGCLGYGCVSWLAFTSLFGTGAFFLFLVAIPGPKPNERLIFAVVGMVALLGGLLCLRARPRSCLQMIVQADGLQMVERDGTRTVIPQSAVENIELWTGPIGVEAVNIYRRDGVSARTWRSNWFGLHSITASRMLRNRGYSVRTKYRSMATGEWLDV